ncbi:MAG: sarcosine oxidase subunit beta, partial [Kiritimatiellia bacterium]
RVTILEASHVGAGSSSRTAAGIRQQFSTPNTVRGMRYSVRFYNAFQAHTGADRAPIVSNGYLFLLNDEAAWHDAKARVQMQRSQGLHEAEALDASQVAQRFPWVDSNAIIGATYCPTDGFLLPSDVYQQALIDARRHGAELVQAAPVQSCRVTNGRIVSVQTPKGPFDADVFVDCTNAWTRRLGQILGAQDLPVDPIKRYLWFIKRDGSMSAEQLLSMPMTITPSGVYCRPENGDSLLVGHAHRTAPERTFSYEDQDRIEPAFAHTGDLDGAPFTAWMDLAEAMPPVGEFAGITATTSGYYATTPDHNPFFGYDAHLNNLVRLVGFSGHGAMFGPFSAKTGLALCEAGHDIHHVELDGEHLDLGAFRLDRSFDRHEQMVL